VSRASGPTRRPPGAKCAKPLRATPLSSPTTDFPNLPGGTDGFWGGTEVQALHAQGGRAYDFWIAGSKVINNGGSHLQAQGDRAHEIEAPLGTKLGSELK